MRRMVYVMTLGLALTAVVWAAGDETLGAGVKLTEATPIKALYDTPQAFVGKTIRIDRPSRIVGVVADVAEKGLTDAAEPVRYVPVAQQPWLDDAWSIVLRAAPGVAETTAQQGQQTVCVSPLILLARSAGRGEDQPRRRVDLEEQQWRLHDREVPAVDALHAVKRAVGDASREVGTCRHIDDEPARELVGRAASGTCELACFGDRCFRRSIRHDFV